MAIVCLEVLCSGHGDDSYPVPTTIRIAQIFASYDQADEEFPEDVLKAPPTHVPGQDVYYVIWDTNEPLNIDRASDKNNVLSNCGSWLPDTERIFADVDLEVEMVPPERMEARRRQRAAAKRALEAAEARDRGEAYNADDLNYVEDVNAYVDHTPDAPQQTIGATTRPADGTLWKQRW